ncbi:hypothetical protein DRN34_02880, partial [Thermococci archaeon]
MSDKVKKVFVYGTLKVGGYFAEGLDKVRKNSAPAKTTGKLINIDNRFPGLIDGEGVVHGEIHEYNQFDRVLTVMDNIEGYIKRDPDNSLYKRRIIEVETESGDMEEVYAYFFNQ